MRFLKPVTICFLTVFILVSLTVSANDFGLSDFNITGISIPDSFSSCTRDDCDEKFSAILSENGYTHTQWKEDVMIPGHLYICSRDAEGNVINVSISDPSTEKDKEDNIKFHRLMYDYNLYESGAKAKEKALIKYRDSLADAGVSKRKIHRIKWFEKEEISEYTPYIMGIYQTKEGLFVCDFCAIYDGNTVSVSLTSKDEPGEESISLVQEIIKKINFENEVDYSQAKQVYRQNQRVKMPERLNVKQKRSRFLIGAALAFISVVILSAIAITTTKIRRRTRSSRNSKFGRY